MYESINAVESSEFGGEGNISHGQNSMTVHQRTKYDTLSKSRPADIKVQFTS
jgi:hypothetical protein